MTDPFATTAELSYRGVSSLGENILNLSGLYAQKKEKEEEKQRIRNEGEFLLKKFGILNPDNSVNEKKAVDLGVNIKSDGEVVIAPKKTEKSLADVGIGGNIDTSGLTDEQLIQGRDLSKRRFGVRGTEKGLNNIYNEMRAGKNIDQIEDSLRYAGQSEEFSPVRNAVQTIMINAGNAQTQRAMDYIDDYISADDNEGVKSQLKRLSIQQSPASDKIIIVTKERTIKLLDEIQNDLNSLERLGINTNIFSGTREQANNKIGLVVNPEAKKIATKIQIAVQNYRRGMTGQAFGMVENKEYRNMFPSIAKTGKLNTAIIEGLKESFSGDLDNFYSLSMGDDNYRRIFGKSAQQQNNLFTQEGQTQQYSQENLEYTAKKRGITVQEVKRRLGVK